MLPETIFTKVRAHFGGSGSDPVYSDALLLSYLNDWIRDTLTKHLTLGTVTTTKAFTGTPSATPIEDDYTANAGTGMLALKEVTWTPTGGTTEPLIPTGEDTLLALGKYPNRDLGTPMFYWVDFGVTAGITTPTFKVHPYPIPNVAGTLTMLSRVGPAACVLATAISFPELFADAAEWFLVYRWRANDEDYSDQDRMMARALHDQALPQALRSYAVATGPKTIRQRVRH